jgi:hypothetical protein
VNRIRAALRAIAARARTAVWRRVLLIAAARARRHRGGKRLYWGPDPIISFKYWSDAMRSAGHDSTALVSHDFENFKAQRFDLYHQDVLAGSKLPDFIIRRAPEYVVFLYLLRSFDVVHIPFTGGPLGSTPLARDEPALLRRAGIKTVLVAYGGDVLRYSWISDLLTRHTLLINYPEAGRRQADVDTQVERWTREADIVVGGLALEGVSRWDVLTTNYIAIPADRVTPKTEWSSADGTAEPVRVIHAPNHRGVKGTEFIVRAIDALQRKGLKIDFVLLEQVPNERVLQAMRDADISVDQCIGSAYGLFAIESMATGCTVLANLEDERLLGVHRQFAWLAQCPIVSVDIERLEKTIERLVRDPALRRQLGQLGIEYVRRFHSPETAQHLFGSIYRKLDGEEVDLMRLFHPLASEYMQRFEPLKPPLLHNRLPESVGADSA